MKVMIPKSKIAPVQTPDFIKSPIQLSISLLVSNRIQTIRKCMDSLKIILDAIPSELIAVDTVGEENSDGSLAVVREYTDKIVHFDWTGDFSAARNAGLELAKGEWFLYVDDDEWFEDPSEIIEFFQNGDSLKYGCTQYVVRNYLDKTMQGYSEGWVSRMGRRTKEMRFIYSIHETLQPIYLPEKKFTKCFAHHVGYIFENEEEKSKHFERNITPVLEELEREPKNLRLIMQAIQEYLFNSDYDKAIEYCRRGEEHTDRNLDTVWNWIVSALVQTLTLQKKYEEAIAEGKRLLESSRVNELARMNIDHVMLSAAQALKDSETALEYSRDFMRLGQWFDEDPDRVLDQVMLSLSDILMEDKRKTVHNYLFVTYKNLERYEELCEYSDTIAWDKGYMKQKMHFLFLMEAAVHAKNYGCLTRAIQKIGEPDGFPKEWVADIRKVCGCESKETKYNLRKAFTQVDSEDSYFLVLKAWCAEQDGGNLETALQECLKKELDCAPPREELLGICLRNGFDPTPFLEPLYMEDWAVSFSQLVKNTAKDDLQALLDAVQETLRPISESQCFALSKMIRQRMLDDPDFPEDELWETAKAYAEDILGYNRSIYREELFADSKHNLPRETVFALYLKEALESKAQGNFDKTLISLKECLKAYPPKKALLTRLIHTIKQEIEQKNQQQQEFSSLGEQIKKQIYYLISLGEMVQAQQVLEQLRTLTPHDRELDAILQKIS